MDKKIGMFIGKFLPPHIGHTYQIEKCLKQVDELYVIVADSEERTKEICEQAKISPISTALRQNWLKEHFKNNDKIKFFTLNQGMLEAYPENIDNWKNKLNLLTGGKAKIWFVDKNFLEISKKVFPEYEFIGFDRTNINVSATMVREDFKKNFDYIIPEAKDYFKEILK